MITGPICAPVVLSMMRKSLRSLPCAYTPTASRVASRFGTTAPIFVLPDGSSATGSNSSDFATVDPRVQLRLRLAAPRPLEEFARVLEQRRIGLVAIEIARELVLHARHRRRVGVEELHGRRMLRARPGRRLGILAVLEPAVAIGQRRAVQHVDHRSRGRIGREERGCCRRIDRRQHCRCHDQPE